MDVDDVWTKGDAADQGVEGVDERFEDGMPWAPDRYDLDPAIGVGSIGVQVGRAREQEYIYSSFGKKREKVLAVGFDTTLNARDSSCTDDSDLQGLAGLVGMIASLIVDRIHIHPVTPTRSEAGRLDERSSACLSDHDVSAHTSACPKSVYEHPALSRT